MANRRVKKVPLDKDCLFESLKFRGKSIRQLGVDHTFGWSSKSVERGVKSGEISEELLDALGRYLDVEPDYLSGKYHKSIDSIKDEDIRIAYKSQLSAKKHPYILAQQRTKYGDRFLSEKYIEYMLILHNISYSQFEEMNWEHQKSFLLDLEDSVIKILIKHFKYNAFGQSHLPDILAFEAEIQCYDPDET